MGRDPDRPAQTARRGRLVLVPTPIGNLADITHRAAATLAEAQVIACEDTRRTRILLSHLGFKKRLLAVHQHNWLEAGRRLLTAASENDWLVAYCSDSGTPGLSDPGVELLALAEQLGLTTDVLPGANALVPAAILSGLVGGRFRFEGFLPARGRERRERLEAVLASPDPVVLFEAPHRLHRTLTDLAAGAPERAGAVIRELSKVHQETRRASLAGLAAWSEAGVRGECVLVVAGIEPPPTGKLNATTLAARMVADGLDHSAIVSRLRESGVSRNQAYRAALEAARRGTNVG